MGHFRHSDDASKTFTKADIALEFLRGRSTTDCEQWRLPLRKGCSIGGQSRFF
jgi:hypothetical protein